MACLDRWMWWTVTILPRYQLRIHASRAVSALVEPAVTISALTAHVILRGLATDGMKVFSESFPRQDSASDALLACEQISISLNVGTEILVSWANETA
ncbi:unnamed protein product [Dovyalis caffra]|uniref:Uncharacterized protein n=1 Tax=Dovyalis caffra TaxID=77055 RepID=A0AAV1S060_9ROSI|nr:unnamed protein product [Dovyalis caffra]